MTSNDTGYFTDHIDVKSSNLRAVYYDDPSRSLYVEFKNGHGAGYRDVTRTAFLYLANASSPGRFYNQSIKGHFSGQHFPSLLKLRTEDAKTNVDDAPVKADYGFIYTYTVDVEVTRVEQVQVEAKNVQDALEQAKKVGNPVKIAWEL